MSASQAERRRFESGHPLESFRSDQPLAARFDQLHHLRAHVPSTALLIESTKNQACRFCNLPLFGSILSEREKFGCLISVTLPLIGDEGR